MLYLDIKRFNFEVVGYLVLYIDVWNSHFFSPAAFSLLTSEAAVVGAILLAPSAGAAELASRALGFEVVVGVQSTPLLISSTATSKARPMFVPVKTRT